jgi:hypothetical protein
MPYALLKNNISSNEGLIMDLFEVQRMAKEMRTQITLLVDINIFYRIAKLLYSSTFMEYNCRGAMANLDMNFGIWHAYAHVVKRLRTVFLSWWSSLEYSDLLVKPAEVSVYLFPKFVEMEYMLTSMYCVREKVGPHIRRMVAQAIADHGDDHFVTHCARMLELLMLRFVPYVFNLGVTVRIQCVFVRIPYA